MIYLDYNATAIPDRAILQEALEFSLKYPANSSGLSLASQNTNRAIEECRNLIGQTLQINPQRIIFTSSASEANHIFITTLWLNCLRHNKNFKPLFSRLEHPSITELIQRLPHCQPIEYHITLKGELANPEKINQQLTEASCVIMTAVHNETGLILPVKQMQQLISNHHLPFLCDFSQAANKMADQSPITFNYIQEQSHNLTFFSLAGHKLAAGYGAGLLIRPDLPQGKFFEEQTLSAGGNQEFNIRAGSHNLMAIRALALAIEKRKQEPIDYLKLRQLSQNFEMKLKLQLKDICPIKIIGEEGKRLVGTSLVMFPGAKIDFLIMGLDRAGITVSTGTSCKSRSRLPSPALLSLGFSKEEALSVVRFSYDTSFTEDQQAYVIEQLTKILPAVL